MSTIGINDAHAKAERFIPRPETSELAIPAPGEGRGYWNGASSAVVADDITYLAYRHRQPIEMGRGQGVVLAQSPDGVHFDAIGMIEKHVMDAESLERPTLIHAPSGKWHLYLSCATTGTKHWRVELIIADAPDEFDATTRQVVMPGDEKWAVKDTVIQIIDDVWHCWATFHPLDIAEHEDRMWSKHATSSDGIEWNWDEGFCLSPREGKWDSRGARITDVVNVDGTWIAFYDGRASAEENYDERTGIAVGASPDKFESISDEVAAEGPDHQALRYLDIVPLPEGKYRLYYEIALPDSSHELRTQVV